MFLWSAIVLGFLGSFHCIGMCGPIAIMLPEKQGRVSKGRLIAGKLLYNCGRLLTYSILGFLIGTLGFAFSVSGIQIELSIVSAFIILIFSLISIFGLEPRKTNSLYSKIYSLIREQFRKLFRKNSSFTLFLIGMLNGMLPCGFVFLGLMGALSTGTAFSAMAYMAAFGLATFPAMLTVSALGNLSKIRFSKYIKKASPYAGVFLAIVLLMRAENQKTKQNLIKPATEISSSVICH